MQDGACESRVVLHVSRRFAHNDVCTLHAALLALREAKGIVFVAVALEGLYNMDDAVAPLFPDRMGLEAAGWSRCSAGGTRVRAFGKELEMVSDGAFHFYMPILSFKMDWCPRP